MKIVSRESIQGSSRVVKCPKNGFTSNRLLLASDNMGFTLTETHIPMGPPQFWHYKNHLEACYCVYGYGELINKTTNEKHMIRPGSTYVLDSHEPHTFQALMDTVLVCVFNPPLKGTEVHKEDGSYGI